MLLVVRHVHREGLDAPNTVTAPLRLWRVEAAYGHLARGAHSATPNLAQGANTLQRHRHSGDLVSTRTSPNSARIRVGLS